MDGTEWVFNKLFLGVITGVVVSFLSKPLIKFTEQLSPVAKVDWSSALGRVHYRSSRQVYCRLPDALQDEDKEIRQWLAEAATNERQREIYLVSRGFDGANGILYASLYPKYGSTVFRGAMCAVNALVVRKDMDLGSALAIETRLWKKLKDEVGKCIGDSPDRCSYFFQILDPERAALQGTYSLEDEQSRRVECLHFLDSVQANKVLDVCPIPDLAHYDENAETPAVLYHVGPAGPVSELEALNFLYGFHYFWQFIFGEELTDMKELSARFRYVQSLTDRVVRQATC